MTFPVKDKKFDPTFALVDRDGKPTQLGRDYLVMVDRLLTALVGGVAPNGLVNAANDAAAAAAGVAIGNFYRNGSVMMVRVV